jgi:hypothetical protein
VKAVYIWRYAVSFLAIVSLIVNGVLGLALLEIRQGMQSALTAARDSLEVARTEPVRFTVSVYEQVPINTTLPLSDTFTVPIRFDFPLSTQVTTHINIPILGRQEIVVPVDATIPVSQTLEIPLRMTVPIHITPTLDMDVPVEVVLPAELIDALEDFIDNYEAGLRLPLR